MSDRTICCESCGAANYANVICIGCLHWKVRVQGPTKLLLTLLANAEMRVVREGASK